MNKKNGFTLIEVMVTLAIFAMLVFGVSAMLGNIFINSNQDILSMTSIDQARAVLAEFTNEIRDATTGSDGSYPINQAGNSQIIFYSNFGTGNGVIERIRYYISGNTLYKGVVIPIGNPLSYNLSSESQTPVLNGISNTSDSIFYYYDGNYDGSTNSLSQPVNINNIRFVKINLSVLNKITANSNSAFTVSSGATIRSVKDNLGN